MVASTSTYTAWQRLSGTPGGSRLFSLAAMARVPYFASAEVVHADITTWVTPAG